jgi:hypothetical protein
MKDRADSMTPIARQETESLAHLPGERWARLRSPIHPSWTRRSLAWTVVIGYLILLAAIVGTAIVLLFISRPVNDVQQAVITLVGALSALAGILGFVVGYYFKSEEIELKSSPIEPLSEAQDSDSFERYDE